MVLLLRRGGAAPILPRPLTAVTLARIATEVLLHGGNRVTPSTTG
nr:hypothetical protein [uncultured Friedmanniella sp.]